MSKNNISQYKSEFKYRPYSQNELKEIREKNLGRMHIGNTMCFHDKCNHFYFAKKGGKKEDNVINNNDYGSCSVCWKLRNSFETNRNSFEELIDEYNMYFSEKPDKWTIKLITLEKNYYKWLYYGFGRKKRIYNEKVKDEKVNDEKVNDEKDEKD